jgi:MarR family transcriptional regulator, organic hydroperoxide resistance regulator
VAIIAPEEWWKMSLIDSILELKDRCHLAEEIGQEYQLSPKEIECVVEVGAGDGVCSKNLSESIGLSPSRGSRIINRLISKGIIENAPCRGDKRYVELSLTEDGRVCLDAIERKKMECEKEILGSLNDEERNTVAEGISLLLKVL